MLHTLQKPLSNCKTLFTFALILLTLLPVTGCSTNPATGQQQFTALMSPEQENRIGAQQHEEIKKQYSIGTADPKLQSYVDRIGQKVSANTERPDVQYKFFVIDSPIVNAFAVPGGYIYISRGILATANSEAEVAAVLAHEVGHITGRHSAARYSQGVLTSLGAIALSTALDSSSASELVGLGSNLYLSSYSRSQEHESDDLGIRYLARAGYDPLAMSRFMMSLQANTELDSKLDGRPNPSGGVQSYLSTHPQTADRVDRSAAMAGQYPKGPDIVNRNEHFRVIDGIIYGESEREGFVRGNSFYHKDMDFMFTVPNGFRIQNSPSQVVASDNSGAIIIFDAKASQSTNDPLTFLTREWMANEQLQNVERITINGRNAATGSFSGRVNNQPVLIQLVAVQWTNNQFYRFQVAIPQNTSRAKLDDLKAATYSLRPLTAAEKRSVEPYKIDIVTARSGDTVQSLANRMPFSDYKVERFRVLNGLYGNSQLKAGQQYKIVVQ